MSKKAHNKAEFLLRAQDAHGSYQVQRIVNAINSTLAWLKSPAGAALVASAPERAKNEGSEAVLIGPDMHFHWADPACVSIFLKAIVASRPGRIVLLGDLIEAGAFSAHKKKTMREDKGGYIDAEIYTAQLFLDAVQELAPDSELIVLGGNHEARVEAFAASLPGAAGMAVFEGCDPYRLFTRKVDGTERKHFRVIPYQKALSHYEITPDLWAIHGWFCGINFCMDTLRKSSPISMVCGHAHRQQRVCIRDAVRNTKRVVWSPGTLSLTQPLWNAPNPTDWIQGFSVVYVGAKGSWADYTTTILNNECVMPGGTVIIAEPEMPLRMPEVAGKTAASKTPKEAKPRKEPVKRAVVSKRGARGATASPSKKAAPRLKMG